MVKARSRRRFFKVNRKTPLRLRRRKISNSRKARVIAGALFTMCFASAQSKNTHLPDYKIISDWDCIKKKDGITLCERWVKLENDQKVRERKGIMLVSCSLDEAREYLNKTTTIKDWMSAVSSIEEVCAEEGKSELVHIVLGLPWPFDNRDIVGCYEVDKVDDKHEIVRIYSVDGIKEDPEAVRIKKYCATWTLEVINTDSTKVIFETFSDEPALFPLWIQDPVVKKVYYSNLESLKAHLSALD